MRPDDYENVDLELLALAIMWELELEQRADEVCVMARAGCTPREIEMVLREESNGEQTEVYENGDRP